MPLNRLLFLLALTLSSAGATAITLTLTAGQHYQQTGSDLIALQGDIAVTAQDIALREARETSRTTFTQKTQQSGLTLSISGACRGHRMPGSDTVLNSKP